MPSNHINNLSLFNSIIMKAIKFSAIACVTALTLGLSSCSDKATALNEEVCALTEKAADALTDCKDKDDIRDTADELYDIAEKLMELDIERKFSSGEMEKDKANRTKKENEKIHEANLDRAKDALKQWESACEYIQKDDELSKSFYLKNAINAVKEAN